MATLRQQVGDLVRHWRKVRGWTQDDLAEKAGRSVELVNRIERGGVAPSFDTLEIFAKVLEVDVRDFFGVGDHAVPSRRDDGLAKIVGRISGLDRSDLDWIDELVRVALARKVRNPPVLKG